MQRRDVGLPVDGLAVDVLRLRRADPVRIATGRTASGALRVGSDEGVSDVFQREVGGRIEAVAL